MPINKEQQKKIKELGLKVKSIRERKGLTLSDVAYKIDKDRQSIHRLEAGSTNPTYIYLLEVCKGLDIDIIELLKDL